MTDTVEKNDATEKADDATPPGSYNADEIERLFFQMDNLLHARVNSLLLGESIFFLVAAALSQHALLLVVIAVLGLCVTFLFGFTNLKLYFRVSWLIEQFKTYREPLYGDYLSMKGFGKHWEKAPFTKRVFSLVSRDTGQRWLDSGWLFAWGLSLIFSLGWLVFLIFGIWSF